MPLQATSGAASYDAFGGGVPFEPIYIEQVFQNWLYAGNGSTQTITNGIDLAGEGGLVWIKARSVTSNHRLFDTTRGVLKPIYSDLANAQATEANTLTAFNADGFTLGSDAGVNQNTQTWASWTFRKQPKFFDVVTWVGNGTNQTVNHSLGSLPGCIIYKRTDSTSDWFVSTRNSAGNYEFLKLNTTAASVASVNPASLDVTATSFDPLRLWGNVNGASYVAYLFAHNAGGFGLTGTDNVISCGSLTLTSGNVTSVSLGWEPQWLLVKKSSSTQSWQLFDNMRGFLYGFDGTNSRVLNPNTTAVEANLQASPLSDGFALDANNWGAGDYIYIAIRRGPMKTPTTGTSVFSNRIGSDNSLINTTNLVDAFIDGVYNASNTYNFSMCSRLTGRGGLVTSSTAAELANWTGTKPFEYNRAYFPQIFASGAGIQYAFSRAPSVFDVVCYTGTGAASQTLSHNLTVAPELMLVKSRTISQSWVVYVSSLGNTSGLLLNGTNATLTGRTDFWNSTTPTSTTFAVGDALTAAGTYVAYLFASCPGVSKVFNYTGNGSSQTINCGFTGGARFVMIKRTDSTGDWYVWDTARGIVANNDPHLSLNTTAAEVTTNDTIDTDSTGFVVNQVSATNVNVNGASYIGLAIA